MHKYFARRPWNVFNDLIRKYSSSGDIILDPFCGGGVTIVESLKLKRRAIGIDVNPLATYVTEMECRPLDLQTFRDAISLLNQTIAEELSSLYRTSCRNCNSLAIADWIEWDEQTGAICRVNYDCPKCGSREDLASKEDEATAKRIAHDSAEIVRSQRLWFPKTCIPNGDKTDSLLSRGINSFNELFTPRNLLALSELRAAVDQVKDKQAREFLRLAFSSSLKWASRQSHLRGSIVEGWAMHAYWIYPKSLEINVWNTFKRRTSAILRGKEYSNQNLGMDVKFSRNFREFSNVYATCLLLTASSSAISIPDNSIDAIVTDPPYGGNVNYAELSDYWHVWLNDGETIQKNDEVIINKTQGKGRKEYEELLSSVLVESYRVLKPDKYLVSTFNSKDVRIVASFVQAASKANFTLQSDGFTFQNPIRPYNTTFHAMQVGAFVGDFIFAFKKTNPAMTRPKNSIKLDDLKDSLRTLISESVKGQLTEPQLREKSYGLLIPFLATTACSDLRACQEATSFFESEMREHESHFRQLRKRIVRNRKRTFRTRR
jgi:DNA-directed RNA polymerase subunit M/transcription elongation factor TFIIS/16S rRNA G966 N2-methylase RsmD